MSLPPVTPAAEAFSAPHRVPLLGARAGVGVQVAPDKRITLHDTEPLERLCVAELIPIGGGTYRVVPRLATTWVRFSRDRLLKLGIELSENTMQRLGRAGFIRIRQPSPSSYEFDFQSWLNHCAQVEADPEFWEKKVNTGAGIRTNRQRYLEAL